MKIEGQSSEDKDEIAYKKTSNKAVFHKKIWKWVKMMKLPTNPGDKQSDEKVNKKYIHKRKQRRIQPKEILKVKSKGRGKPLSSVKMLTEREPCKEIIQEKQILKPSNSNSGKHKIKVENFELCEIPSVNSNSLKSSFHSKVQELNAKLGLTKVKNKVTLEQLNTQRKSDLKNYEFIKENRPIHKTSRCEKRLGLNNKENNP